MLCWLGRGEAAWPVWCQSVWWHCLSGILCFILPLQPYRLLSDSAGHADSKYMVSLNFFYQKLCKTSKNVCRKKHFGVLD